jgi:hypothetical protein
MNNRPRKCLGYKTPFEVFAKMTGKDYFLNGSVALFNEFNHGISIIIDRLTFDLIVITAARKFE